MAILYRYSWVGSLQAEKRDHKTATKCYKTFVRFFVRKGTESEMLYYSGRDKVAVYGCYFFFLELELPDFMVHLISDPRTVFHVNSSENWIYSPRGMAS